MAPEKEVQPIIRPHLRGEATQQGNRELSVGNKRDAGRT